MKLVNKREANKKARDYYKTHPKYRAKKIEARKQDAKNDKKGEAEYSREYYRKHPQYRAYKISYARNYRKSHKKHK